LKTQLRGAGLRTGFGAPVKMQEKMPNESKIRFNIVDVIIILMVLALAAGGYYKVFVQNKQIAAQEQKIRYLILVEEVRQPTVDAYSEGQVLWDQKTNVRLGEITKKEVVPATEAVPTAEGKLVLAEIPEKYNLLLTLESPAVVTDNNITIGSREIKIGRKILFKTARAASEGIVYGLDILKP